MLPVVIDGTVIPTSILQDVIGKDIQIQALEPKLIEQMVIFGSPPPLPYALTVFTADDWRADN